MIILEHSTYGERTIAANLGLPEYSYWFVRKAFAPILERLGVVVPVVSPEQDVDRIFRSAEAHGQPCVFLSFSPPHQTPVGLACPTVPVFAWEYDTIPDEAWNGEDKNDWRKLLEHAPAAITHSQFSVHAVRKALGPTYPIWSIPAPVADRRLGLEATAKGWRKPTGLEVSDALVFDSWAIDLSLFAYGVAAQSERAMRLLQTAARQGVRAKRRIELEGVVYTTVMNPVDGRKNWADMAAAFIYAFREEPHATLVLKTTHRDMNEAVTPILQDIAKLGRFRCRIVILHGLLNDVEYARLMEVTSYAVNTSHGEGQCLPLMEYMAAGRPAVAPRHTAMLEYVSPDNAFVIADHHRPSFWPHDMRQASRCLRHQIEFADLVRRYRESFAVARDQPERYARMSKAAVAALSAFCGDSVVMQRLGELFGQLTPAPVQLGAIRADPHIAAAPSPPAIDEDGFRLGLKDAMLSGWYNEASGELARGFPVAPEDVVVDVGCGDGGAAAFCARVGAKVILADVDASHLDDAVRRLNDNGACDVEAHLTDANPLPLASASVTRVVCMEVLEHVPDPAVLMDELVRVGKPGALYLLTVPAEVQERMQQTLAPQQYFLPPNHVRIFTRQAFEGLVTASGLQIEQQFDYSFYWAVWWTFFWQCSTPLEHANQHPLLASWARTWALAVEGRDGLVIQQLMNGLMPKNQVIVARKPA